MYRPALAILSVAFLIQCASGMPWGTHNLPADSSHDSTSNIVETNAPAARSSNLTNTPEVRIEVFKSRRQLLVYSGNRIIRNCRIGLGFNPVGPKVQQGDGRTPEGEYYVCSKNPKSSYYLSLGLSYPNDKDAERGLKSGLINKPQYDTIVAAIRSNSRPPWDTELGGEIFIHGNGACSDWTFGCVAVENADMKELFELIPRGTPVTIKP
jgi:murein L,D-transpeptidase YafK